MKKYYLLVILLVGCASEPTPKTTAECTKLYKIGPEINACEERVVHREDQRYKRAMRNAMAERCKWPNIWDGRYEVCRGHIYY